MDRGRVLVAALVAGALMVVVLGTNLLGPWQLTPRFSFFMPVKGTPPPVTPPAAPNLPQGTLPPGAQSGPIVAEETFTWILRVLVTLAVLAAVVFVAGLLWRLRRTEPEQIAAAAPQVTVHEVVRDAVTTAREHLQRHRRVGDAAATIIAAWAALERAAAESGHERDPTHTPSEFTADLLNSVSAAEQEIAELLRLYHRARYGSADVVASLTDADADRADDLLRVIAERMPDHPDTPFRRPTAASGSTAATSQPGNGSNGSGTGIGRHA